MTSALRVLVLAGAAIVYGLASPAARSADTFACNVVELYKEDPEYNKLVCNGVDLARKKRFTEAASVFESALRFNLHEYPNVALYSRLAQTYLRAGNVKGAGDNLRKAELSLAVLIGAIRCEEVETGFRLRIVNGGITASPFHEEITKQMCGKEVEDTYTQRSFKKTLYEARLIAFYLQVKKEMEKQLPR
jgi:hypothetical protein